MKNIQLSFVPNRTRNNIKSNIGIIALSVAFSFFFLIADLSLNVVIIVFLLTVAELCSFLYYTVTHRHIKLEKWYLSFVIMVLIILCNIRDLQYLDEQPFYVFSMLLFLFLFSYVKPNEQIKNTIENLLLAVSIYVGFLVFISIKFPSFYNALYLNNVSNESRNYSIWMMNQGYSGTVGREISRTNLYLVLGLGICLSRYLSKKSMKYAICCLLYIIIIFLAGRRSELLASILAIIAVCYCNVNSRKKRKYLLIGIVMLLILTLFYILISSNILVYSGENRLIQSVFDLVHGIDITNGRSELYSMAVNLFKENPMFGIGWGGFRNYARTYLDNISNVHNVYLQVFCELGLIGGLPFLGILFGILAHAIRSYKRYKQTSTSDHICFSLFTILFLFIYSLFDNAIYHDEFWLLFSIIIYSLYKIEPRENFEVIMF